MSSFLVKPQFCFWGLLSNWFMPFRLSRLISFTESQLIIVVYHIYKTPSQEHQICAWVLGYCTLVKFSINITIALMYGTSAHISLVRSGHMTITKLCRAGVYNLFAERSFGEGVPHRRKGNSLNSDKICSTFWSYYLSSLLSLLSLSSYSVFLFQKIQKTQFYSRRSKKHHSVKVLSINKPNLGTQMPWWDSSQSQHSTFQNHLR